MISEPLFPQEVISALISFVVSASTYIYQSKSTKKIEDLKELMGYCKSLRKIINAYDADAREEEFMNILYEFKEDVSEIKCLQKNLTEILDKIKILKYSFPEITKSIYSIETIDSNKSKLQKNLKTIKEYINNAMG